MEYITDEGYMHVKWVCKNFEKKNWGEYNINESSTIWLNWANDWAVLWVLTCTVHLAVCCYHVTYSFESEFTLYICLNIKEFLSRNRHDIWSLSNCNGNPTHNHLVCKRTRSKDFLNIQTNLECIHSQIRT